MGDQGLVWRTHDEVLPCFFLKLLGKTLGERTFFVAMEAAACVDKLLALLQRSIATQAQDKHRCGRRVDDRLARLHEQLLSTGNQQRSQAPPLEAGPLQVQISPAQVGLYEGH